MQKVRSLLDTLAERLGQVMKYGEGERDMIMLQHRFLIENADGTTVRTLFNPNPPPPPNTHWPTPFAPPVHLCPCKAIAIRCCGAASRRRATACRRVPPGRP